jgi:antitoxin (DNA-binding transcriptional repressor) of toxin-antitoxin stability system
MNEVRERRTEYVITKRGKPVAKLAPCDEVPPDAFGMLAGSVLGYDDIVSPDPEAWGELS